MDKFELAYEKVMGYIAENNFTSYDPYDGLNTPVEFLKISKISRLALIYLQKFSPINLRKLLWVQKSKQLMTLGTIANAMFLFNNLSNQELDFFDNLFAELKQKTLIHKYGYHCWDSRDFPIQWLGKPYAANDLDVVGNEILGSFLINYYRINGNKEVLYYISSLADLLLNEFYSERQGFYFFRYRITDPDESFTLNASLKAMAFLIKASEILNNDSFHEPINKVLNTVLELQKDDGRWNYTYWIDKNIEKKQIDFHQGFILDDILLFMQKYGSKESIMNSYVKGLEFYYQKQFLPTGQGIYRYPRIWPTDIHSQAQGIITFTHAAKAGMGNHYFEFANLIADWTIKNMQDKDGHFYFLKYPWITNRIPYIRWSDANMAYALSVFLAGR
jgi:hypothetical protein